MQKQPTRSSLSTSPDSASTTLRFATPWARHKTMILWLLIATLMLAIYVADLWSPIGLAVPTCYVAALILVIIVRRTLEKLLIAAGCTALVTLHYFLSSPFLNTPHWAVAINYGSIVTMIWTVTILSMRHQRAELARRQSEELHRILYDETPTMYFSVDESGVVRSVNQFGAAELGYRPEQLIGRSVLEVFYEEDRATVSEHLARAFQSKGSVTQWEFRKVRRDGSLLWVREWIRIVTDHTGLPMALIVCEDITEHKRSEEALRNSEERFRALVEASAQIVWTTDAQGKYVDDSPSWRAFTGQSYEQSRNSGWINAYHPDDHKRILANWQKAVTEHAHMEAQYRLRRHDGQWRWVQVRAVPLFARDGTPHGWVGMNSDITERKHAERDTLFLLDTSECIRIATDPDELTWVLSVAAGEHLQVSRCAFIEIDLSNECFTVQRDYHPHAPSVAGTYSLNRFSPAVINAGKAGRTTVVNDTSRDERTMVYVEAYQQLGVGAFIAVPLLREGKLVSGLVVGSEEPRDWSEREITLIKAVAERTWLAVEKLRLNEALRQSGDALREADHRKDEFLATLAHELRNPLSLIRNVVSLIQIPGSSQEELQWGRDIIDRQTTYLTRLTDDLFDVSRISRQKLEIYREEAELNEIVRTAVETSRPFIDQRGHELIVTSSRHPIWVEADKVRLTQVIMNLLNNAAKYTPKPGHIWLNVDSEDKSAVIRVTDSGLGIAPENLLQVFDLFYQVDRSFTRTEGGLGLGLTLVKRLVELHGGTVEAHSAGLNKGSEFIIRLPVLYTASHSPARESRSANGTNKSPPLVRRILVADDFPESADTLAKLLRLDGAEVQIAHDGFEALEAAESFRPEVAVLDIAMPKLNGYDAARMIREQPWGKSMVLIALTGWGQHQDRRRTREAGFDAHITKPIKYEDLLEVLGNLPSSAGLESIRNQDL